MSQDLWKKVDDYFIEQLVPSDPALDAALLSSEQAGLPSINVAPNQGKFLHLLAKIRGARRILEIGTLGGYSTIWLARALPENGTLLSLEADAGYADLAAKNLEFAGLSSKASIVVGDAKQTLIRLIEEKTAPFDLIFIDADKENNPHYLELSLQLSQEGTVIVGDNVVRKGRVADVDSTDPDVIGVHQYVEALASNPTLSSTAIQTVGAKGWDGFSITVVSAS